MSSMWFDAATGRLHFTLNGTNRLFYRYFTPESRIVGAVRHEVATTDTGLVRSGSWRDGPVNGTSTTVSGPGVDDVAWRSRTLFLYAG